MTIDEQNLEFQKQAEKFRDSAFPTTLEFQYEANSNLKFVSTSKGLSKREYFAIKILQGMFASDRFINGREHMAEEAAAYADALIKKLEAGKR